MIALSKNYSKNGYHHRQVYRQDDIAIYELTSPETGRFLCYEVFEIIQIQQRLINGSLIEAREVSPSNEQWGIKGYTVWQISAAMEKVDIIRAKHDHRNLSKRIGLESI